MIYEGVAEALGSSVEGLAYEEGGDGGNVFIDHTPQSPDRCVSLYTTTGRESDSKLPYDDFRFQVIIRCESGSDWASRAWERIYSHLHGLRHTVLPNGDHLVYLLAEHASPWRLPSDANGRVITSAYFRGESYVPTEHRS